MSAVGYSDMPLVRPSETETASSGRAATYVRVSTGQQKYSIENQAAALAAYAARRSISIVHTYRDQGRSGVRIAGRDGLQDLIQDVQSERADFDCILVYDVSRWGRFQDVDESAYYEFICKRAGIKVHYCADEFENDGSLASIILKNIKRVAAADYSRQLSKKVFLGQCRVATQGYWRGGPAGYGLRRLLLDESGKPKTLLQYGQRKNLKTERVILVPGPKLEVKIIQRIFASFAIKKRTRTEIAAELNAEHIPNARGMPWSMLTVSNTLKNEAYIGNLVYNRRSQKLGERQVKNPPDMWIRRDNAFRPIVSPTLFAKAKKVLVELENGRTLSDKELLDKLKSLWRRKGHLSLKIMLAAKDVPNPTLYTRRFGSITGAYKRIGFKPESRYNFTEHTAKIDGVVCSVAADIIAAIEKRGRSTTFLHELYLLTLSRNFTVSVTVAWHVANGKTGHGRWQLRKIRYTKSDLTLVIRLNTSNVDVQDYFLLPTTNLPPRCQRDRIAISNRIFAEFRHDDLDEVVRALDAKIGAGNIVRRTRTDRVVLS